MYCVLIQHQGNGLPGVFAREFTLGVLGPMRHILEALMRPRKLWMGSELLTKPNPIPKSPGIYAWYFRALPEEVLLDDCHRVQGYSLLYLGIAPSRATSSATLRSRIGIHLKGNASSSTLRFTLGCLLAKRLGITLQCHGPKQRLTFRDGESSLSSWLKENAMVAWVECDSPWTVEARLVSRFAPPLNLDHNGSHPFYEVLRSLREFHRHRARSEEQGKDAQHPHAPDRLQRASPASAGR
jgi:hypothetical protein